MELEKTAVENNIEKNIIKLYEKHDLPDSVIVWRVEFARQATKL